MDFVDGQLKTCYARNFAEAKERAEKQPEIVALVAAHDVFCLVEGPHSPRVHEAIEHLLSPGLRPLLRKWYASASEPNRAGTAFRHELNHLAGETL